MTLSPSRLSRQSLSRPYEFERLMCFLILPNAPSRVVYDYVVALKDRFHERSLEIEKRPSRAGFNAFEKIALKAGIVKTFFQIARDERRTMERVFTSYFAAECLWNLLTLGTPAERRQLGKELVEKHDVVDFCLTATTSAFFIVHRTVAMVGLRLLVTQGFLKDHLSVAKTSEIMKALCGCMLTGPKLWIEQLRDPATTWQSMYCFGSVGAPTAKARRYAPRYYSMYQENAAWTVLELMFRYPVPEQVYYNQLIEHDPEVIDALLKVGTIQREPWYAQLEIDLRGVETLVLMLNLPAEMVPGIEIQVDDDCIRSRLENRWEDLMKGIGLLTARPKWCQMILDVWNHIATESPDDIQDWLERAQDDYFAMEPYKSRDFIEIMTLRGCSRIAVQRLISTISFSSERQGNNLTDGDLLKLLGIGNSACQVIKTEHNLLGFQDESLVDAAEVIERQAEAFDKPNRADPVGKLDKNAEHVLQINDEGVTGPTCQLRLYVALAKRGLFEKVQQWNSIPAGVIPSTPTNLQKLKKWTSEAEVRRSLALSVERLFQRRQDGNKEVRDKKKFDFACFEYWSAAQLAAAIVEFDEVTNGKYQDLVVGVRKELVLNLGNAAEMALVLKYFDRALVFASASVKISEALTGNDAIDINVIEKNRRRIDRAQAAIRETRASN
ncbi:hypothetical protein DFP72DRAFT_845614 [Ephemerocybe angulata]|uniref:Uncharacterized protein n=1 Tax=Ephemerocybe angulata TaxID=980116 RepID=A0A8H6I2T1_9AGAR|nr:hypothetical protein DFP72DRAFT_845614 [Tulosesus angulatus]